MAEWRSVAEWPSSSVRRSSVLWGRTLQPVCQMECGVNKFQSVFVSIHIYMSTVVFSSLWFRDRSHETKSPRSFSSQVKSATRKWRLRSRIYKFNEKLPQSFYQLVSYRYLSSMYDKYRGNQDLFRSTKANTDFCRLEK